MRTYKEQTDLILSKVARYNDARNKWNKIIRPVSAAAICFLLIFTLTIPGVRAALQQLFAFIPGTGIVKTGGQPIYVMSPICEHIESGGMTLSLYGVAYAEGRLSLYIYEEGKDLFNITDAAGDLTGVDGLSAAAATGEQSTAGDLTGARDTYNPHDAYNDFDFYINDELVDGKNIGRIDNTYTSSDSTILNFYLQIPAPEYNDIFKIKAGGFDNQLSFKLTPCSSYDDISQIGPTQTRNGISVTAVAAALDDCLTVWCYPFHVDGAIKDSIMSYGNRIGSPLYIETDDGTVYNEILESTLRVRYRNAFDLPADGRNASLYIPCLSMYREETIDFSVNLPRGYGADTGVQAVECSLGIIKIVETRRIQPDEFSERITDASKDIVTLKFAYESNDGDMMRLYDASLSMHEKYDLTIEGNAETGGMEYCKIRVDGATEKISLTIQGIGYDLFGEYVIPLEY